MNKLSLKAVGLLVMVLILAFCFPVSPQAKSAKSILSSAVKKMKKAKSISFNYKRVQNMKDSDGSRTQYRTGIVISDGKIDYGVYVDESQSAGGWIEYSKKGVDYRKPFDSIEYTKYTNTNGNKMWKAEFEYSLTHLKNVKLSSTSSKSYTITGKPAFKANFKKVTITINKKTGRITKVKRSLAKRTNTYLNSKETFTVTGGVLISSRICYGDDTLSLPAELRGK